MSRRIQDREKRRRGRHRVILNLSGMWRKRDEPVLKEAGVEIVDWTQGLAVCPGHHKDGFASIRYNGTGFTISCPRALCSDAVRQANDKIAAVWAKKRADKERALALFRERLAAKNLLTPAAANEEKADEPLGRDQQ
jgi:hypothetical protein